MAKKDLFKNMITNLKYVEKEFEIIEKSNKNIETLVKNILINYEIILEDSDYEILKLKIDDIRYYRNKRNLEIVFEILDKLIEDSEFILANSKYDLPF